MHTQAQLQVFCSEIQAFCRGNKFQLHRQGMNLNSKLGQPSQTAFSLLPMSEATQEAAVGSRSARKRFLTANVSGRSSCSRVFNSTTRGNQRRHQFTDCQMSVLWSVCGQTPETSATKIAPNQSPRHRNSSNVVHTRCFQQIFSKTRFIQFFILFYLLLFFFFFFYFSEEILQSKSQI